MKILIIDDEFYIVEDIRLNTDWDKLGISEQYTAHSVPEAKHVMEQHPDMNIVLTDIEMPKENGFDFIRWLHEKNLNPVVLLLTGHERFDYAHSAIELHVQNYLTKPVDIHHLESTLAKAVKELFHADNELKVIGIRHGEKMYETLLTDEECVNAIDLGNFYRVPADKRDLNYDKYLFEGMSKNALTQFNSNNTKLMDVEAVKNKLLEVKLVQEELIEWENT